MMTFEEFQSKWHAVIANPAPNAMIRVDSNHPLSFFVGVDNLAKPQLMLISDFEPRQMVNSRAISVVAGKRQDARWAICFVLTGLSVKDEFMRLCWDLVDVSKSLNTSKDDINYVLMRFTKWQHLMEHGRSGLLSDSIIKGLVGELLFLEQEAFKNYGKPIAVQGWVGPNGADRDFVYADTWFEIKAADPSATAVGISSVEQLDIDQEGQLVIFFLESTSPTASASISLTEQVNRVRNQLQGDPEAALLFENKLLELGYIDRKEYNEYVFVERGRKFFCVNESFPRLRRKTVPIGVQRVEYSISLSAITAWELR